MYLLQLARQLSDLIILGLLSNQNQHLVDYRLSLGQFGLEGSDNRQGRVG